ncbi:MAG: type II toxin-antitoxin system VapB family antitoxin [Thermocrispum sp.]
MARTNIDIDDELVGRVMQKFNLKTKREAVNFALHKVAGPRLTAADLDAVRGIGWDRDLDDLRGDQAPEW